MKRFSMRGYRKRERGHTFHYVLPNGKKDKLKADVYSGRQAFDLGVTLADMVRSEKLAGPGTTDACGAAICADTHRDIVPHDFIWATFTDSMAYFVVELSLGKRAKCIAYEHKSDVPLLFDSRAGRRQLREILKEQKEIKVQLYPLHKRKSQKGRGAPAGAQTGDRTHTVSRTVARGHARRLERALPFLQEAQVAAKAA